MGGGKETQQQQQTQTATNTLDPEYKSLIMGNVQDAKNRASTLTNYTGPLVAGFNPTQIAAQSALTGIGNDPSFKASNNNAISGITGVVNHPLDGNVSASNVTAGSLAGTDLSPYLDPYTNDVINQTVSQNERARQIANVANDRQALAGKAFGGSRSGIINAATNEGYDRNTGSMIADLNSKNFTQAQGAAQFDIGNKLTADTGNADRSLTAQQNSFGNNLAANNQTLDASGRLIDANKSAMGSDITQAGLISTVGDAQQAQDQAGIDAAYQAWATGQQLTQQQQQMIDQALGLVPNQQTVSTNGTSNGTTTKSGGGIGGLLGGLGALGSGLGAMGVSL